MFPYKYVFVLILVEFINTFANEEVKDLLLNTTNCQIPNVILEFNDEPGNGTCGERLVFIEKVSSNRIKFIITGTFERCCYSFAYRSRKNGVEDFEIEYTKCNTFKYNSVVKLWNEFIKVECVGPKYVDHYAVVMKINNIKENKDGKDNGWNVIMLGMDTMSRSRAYQSLPNTINYFQSNNWLDFRGYNKVGSNSLPNLIPLLTGRSTNWLLENTKCKDVSVCNNLLIWHTFKKAGYVTAFAEDGAHWYDSSNLNVNDGFRKNVPTDHYLRPLSLMGERREEDLQCNGQLSTTEHILNYISDLALTYNDTKFFGFFWINMASHDVQSPTQQDSALVDFFKNLEYLKTFENSFVIFLSDHGVRYIDFYHIDLYYEARLPMLFMHVPEKFKLQHAQHFQNLHTNQHRLISPIDVHITLKNILSLQGYKNINPTAAICEKCLSIFKEIPESRRCDEAGIDVQWCACHRMNRPHNKDFGRVQSLNLIAKFLRNYPRIISQQNCFQCAKLTIKKVARIELFSVKNDKFYIIAAYTNPHDNLYEVIVRKFLKDGKYNYEVYRWQRISLHVNKCTNEIKRQYEGICECVNSDTCTRGISLWKNLSMEQQSSVYWDVMNELLLNMKFKSLKLARHY